MSEQALDALLVRLYRSFVFVPGRVGEEQLGVLYVATAAHAQGYRVEVLDQPNLSIEGLKEYVDRRQPRVVGFYTDHENVFPVLSAIRLLKLVNPSRVFVTGGPQSREWDKRILQESPCDVVVRGEGEITFAALLGVFVGGEGHLESIPGITWRQNGMVRRNADADPLDLNAFPIPDRSLNPARATGTGVENLITGRGCPFRCTFCYEGRPEAKYRPRALDNVVEELEYLILKRRARYITVLDDVFTLNPNRVIEIAKLIGDLRKRSGIQFIWFCEARADIICKRPDMLRACVDAGLARVQVGVETGNQQVLDSYNKRLTTDETLRAVEICNQEDVLSVIGNFIVGGAHETEQTLADSIAFGEKLLDAAPGRMEITTTIFTPYPGTPMYVNPEAFGLSVFDADCLSGPGDNYPFATTERLGKWQILDGRQKFVRAIEKKMQTMIATIPIDLARRHFDAFVQHDMRTHWFDFYCRFFNYYNYLGLPAWNPDFRTLDQIPPTELADWKPLRTTFIGTSKDDCLIVHAGHRRVQLSARASAVLELCGGKLPLRAFPMHLRQTGIEVEESEVRDLVGGFDKDRLLVFSRL